jgi:hypothetical protein
MTQWKMPTFCRDSTFWLSKSWLHGHILVDCMATFWLTAWPHSGWASHDCTVEDAHILVDCMATFWLSKSWLHGGRCPHSGWARHDCTVEDAHILIEQVMTAILKKVWWTGIALQLCKVREIQVADIILWLRVVPRFFFMLHTFFWCDYFSNNNNDKLLGAC